MGRHNPFSFNGEIGRMELWLTTIAVNVASLFLNLLPVSQHTGSLNVKNSWGESTISYVTPLEPTLQSELVFAFYCILSVIFVWIICAAWVKRLHDLGHSGKWLLVVLASLALTVALDLAVFRRGVTSVPIEIAKLAALLPAVLIGAYGLFSMYLLRGDTVGRARFDGDLRGAMP